MRLILGLLVLWQVAPLREAQDEGEVRAFLAEHCYDCHGGKKQKAGLDLEGLVAKDGLAGELELLLELREKLVLGVMPPEERPRPGAAQQAALIEWIDATVAQAVEAGRGDPGVARVRRLSRLEYRNTLRDLFAIDCPVHELLPPDEIAHGFENIGDVQSFSPLLLEKYLAAAQMVAKQAVATLLGSSSQRIGAAGLKPIDEKFPVHDGLRLLYSEGSVGATFEIARAGRYRLRARAGADQAGDELAQLLLRLPQRELARVAIAAALPELELHEFEFEAPPGRLSVEAAFVNDYYVPEAGAEPPQDRNLALEYIELEGPLDGVDASAPLAAIFGKLPEQKSDLEEGIGRLLERVWRRPVEPREVAQLIGLTTHKQSPAERLEQAIVAMLVSPHFLLRVELDPPGEKGALHALSAHELATRLSYLIWSSTPDEGLRNLADSGELLDDEVLRAEVVRLLRDARASALIDGFFVPWLGLRRLDECAPDSARFPEFDEDLRQAMRAETELFLEAILFEDRPVSELLLAEFTFVNERLAEHYGLAGVQGERPRRISLASSGRAGLLTQASILTLTSNPTRTSPVKRGKWMLEVLLGTPPKPPPPGVDSLAEDEDSVRAQSMRERLALHRANPDCAACHAALDPLGLALERYGPTGRERDYEEGHPIEPVVEFPNGQEVRSARELAASLIAGGRFERALVERLLVYALGRELSLRDRGSVGDLLERLRSAPPTLAAILCEIVLSPAFRTRRS